MCRLDGGSPAACRQSAPPVAGRAGLPHSTAASFIAAEQHFVLCVCVYDFFGKGDEACPAPARRALIFALVWL